MLKHDCIKNDLEIVHTDFQEASPGAELRTENGARIKGFLTYDETIPDTGDGYDLVSDRIQVLRSATYYKPETIIVQGDVRYKVASVTGEEYAWIHRLREL